MPTYVNHPTMNVGMVPILFLDQKIVTLPRQMKLLHHLLGSGLHLMVTGQAIEIQLTPAKGQSGLYNSPPSRMLETPQRPALL
jgi:hypothetical protein